MTNASCGLNTCLHWGRNSTLLSKALIVCFVLVGLHVSCLAATPNDPPETPSKDIVYHIANMHEHPYFWDVVVASVIGWLIGMVKGFSGSKDWLEKYWPRPPLVVIFLLDLVIFVCVGGYIGTGIYNPLTIVAAFAAGISWPVGLGALVTK